MTTLDTSHYKIEEMMYHGECCSYIPTTETKNEQKKEEKERLIVEALPETMADTINELVDQVYTLDIPTSYPVKSTNTTTTTTTTTTVPQQKKDGPVIVNEVKVTPTEQYDANGRPYEEPIPREFLPPLPELSTGEDWQDDIISEEEFNAVKESMNLPPLPEDYTALAAPHVPSSLVIAGNDYITYMVHKNKLVNDIGKARIQQASLSPTLRAFYAQFGIYAEDRDGKITNWKTVFYVTYLLRMIPSAESYNVTDDLFSGSQGMSEYQLSNWNAKRTHAIRMAVISHLTGDYVEAVYTLDSLMRFRRSMNRRSHCITFHDMGIKNAQRNQSLCFVSYEVEGSLRASWINIGLDKKVVSQMKVSTNTPYYDGPFCRTCTKHHISLIFCTNCYCTQYCTLSCLKKDKKRHAKFCERNKEL